jgi:hypothetical protein
MQRSSIARSSGERSSRSTTPQPRQADSASAFAPIAWTAHGASSFKITRAPSSRRAARTQLSEPRARSPRCANATSLRTAPLAASRRRPTLAPRPGRAPQPIDPRPPPEAATAQMLASSQPCTRRTLRCRFSARSCPTPSAASSPGPVPQLILAELADSASPPILAGSTSAARGRLASAPAPTRVRVAVDALLLTGPTSRARGGTSHSGVESRRHGRTQRADRTAP